MNNKRQQIVKSILGIVLACLFIMEILPTFYLREVSQENGPLYDAENWIQPFDFYDGSNFVIKEHGALIAWGSNRLGVFRETNDFFQMIPVFHLPYTIRPWSFFPALMKMNVKSISADFQVTLAINGFGTLWGWGSNAYSPDEQAEWKQIPKCIMGNVKMAATGLSSCLVLKEDGSLWTWNAYSTADDFVVPYEAISGAKYIALWGDQACAILENGDLYTWTGGHIVDENDIYISPDSPLKIAESAVQTAEARDGLLILKEDHTLWSWERSNPNAGLKKIADCVRYCSDGVLLTDDNKAFIWNTDTLYENPESGFFQEVSKDAVYATRSGLDIYILDKNGRLLRFPYTVNEDGTYTISNPVTFCKNVILPYK